MDILCKMLSDKYCMLCIICWCKRFTIFTVTIQQWKVYNIKYLFYLGIYQKTPNSEIIALK